MAAVISKAAAVAAGDKLFSASLGCGDLTVSSFKASAALADSSNAAIAFGEGFRFQIGAVQVCEVQSVIAV
jgi:hypothetical protein